MGDRMAGTVDSVEKPQSVSVPLAGSQGWSTMLWCGVVVYSPHSGVPQCSTEYNHDRPVLMSLTLLFLPSSLPSLP